MALTISQLIAALSDKLGQCGDVPVLIPLDTGQFAPVESLVADSMFRHDGFDLVFDRNRLARQNKNESEPVVVLSWDEE